MCVDNEMKPASTIAIVVFAIAASAGAQTRLAPPSKDPALQSKRAADPLVPDGPLQVTIPPIGAKSHDTATKLIVRALSEGADLNAPRAMAMGLLGSQMIDASQDVVLGYQSLFAALGKRCKLEAAAQSDIRFVGTANGTDGSAEVQLPAKSIIARREAIVYVLAENLRARYVLDDRGNPATSFGARKSKRNDALQRDLDMAADFLDQIAKAGLADANLADLSGIVAASLQRDGVKSAQPPAGGAPMQTYREALDAALRLARPGKDNADFLLILGQSMETKSMEACTDRFLSPRDAASHKRVVDAVVADLAALRPPVMKPAPPKKK